MRLSERGRFYQLDVIRLRKRISRAVAQTVRAPLFLEVIIAGWFCGGGCVSNDEVARGTMPSARARNEAMVAASCPGIPAARETTNAPYLVYVEADAIESELPADYRSWLAEHPVRIRRSTVLLMRGDEPTQITWGACTESSQGKTGTCNYGDWTLTLTASPPVKSADTLRVRIAVDSVKGSPELSRVISFETKNQEPTLIDLSPATPSSLLITHYLVANEDEVREIAKCNLDRLPGGAEGFVPIPPYAPAESRPPEGVGPAD
jgi:hypothetical protein